MREGRTNGHTPPAAWRGRDPRRLATLLGIACLMLGAFGTGSAYVAIDAVEREAAPSYARTGEVLTRLLPGMLADPARYAAIASGSSPPSLLPDAFLALERLEAKRALDRWIGLLWLGVGLVLVGSARPAAHRTTPGSAERPPHASVGADLAPLALLAAGAYVVLSFFEVP